MKLRKIAAFTAATAVLVGGSMTTAFAADDTNVTVSGTTSLAITNPLAGDFTGVTLDGTAKTTHATFGNFDATDARGTGEGWNVTVQGSQFAEWGDIDGTGPNTTIGYVTGGKTLALNSMLMGVPTVAKKDSTSSAVPTISISAATAVDAGSAVKIASATGPAGMGSYTFTHGDADSTLTGTQNLKLSIPASTYAKTYRSDVTVSIISGP